ncbi:MAG: C10 family peptidase [Bacteroidaceae bacterium]|nr:C10 family peptidase [Bacteroidaceae bacterium]MBR5612020.1 C10 family peptidase [Bacteroidaceae bacterium]
MKRYLFMITTFMFLFISCTDSSELEQFIELEQKKEFKSNHFVEIDEAVEIASQALNKLNGTLSESRNVSNFNIVKQIQTYPISPSRSTETSLYIINFEGGGFAIVPTDNRATDVYALSNEGEFNLNNINSSYFMNLAEMCLKEEIDSVSSLESGISIAAEQPVPGDGPEIYAKVEYNGRECYWYSETTQTRPFYLLATNWHQYDPYRHFCFTNNGENAPAGCTPIAMAQIMAYHQKPASFNDHTYYWDQLTQNPNIYPSSYWADNVAYLVHDIGVDVNAQYGVEETGAYDSDAVATFHHFGYSAILKDYIISEIVSTLDDSDPIYISGGRTQTTTNGVVEYKGHTWVLDGYYRETTVDRYYDVETMEIVYNNNTHKYYLHCNWGWGNNNCYCLSKIFAVNNKLYEHNLKLIYAE